MGCKYIKKKINCNYQNYHQEDLAKAVATVRNKKVSTRKAKDVFGMPKSTIDKVKEKFTNAPGGQTRLMPEFEKMLVEVIDTFANWRLPLDKIDLRMIVKDYLDGKNVEDSKFKDKFLGVDWVNGFVKRYSLTQGFGDRVKVTGCNYFAYLTVLF